MTPTIPSAVLIVCMLQFVDHANHKPTVSMQAPAHSQSIPDATFAAPNPKHTAASTKKMLLIWISYKHRTPDQHKYVKVGRIQLQALYTLIPHDQSFIGYSPMGYIPT